MFLYTITITKLDNIPHRKITLVKLMRQVSGLGLMEAKDFVEQKLERGKFQTPWVLCQNVSGAQATAVVNTLVEIKDADFQINTCYSDLSTVHHFSDEQDSHNRFSQLLLP